MYYVEKSMYYVGSPKYGAAFSARHAGGSVGAMRVRKCPPALPMYTNARQIYGFYFREIPNGRFFYISWAAGMAVAFFLLSLPENPERTMKKRKLVALTGAGMSAESGFETFRDAGGLWERYPVEQVATPEGWVANPTLVTEFYNGLRRQLVAARPNAGHVRLAALEEDFDVCVITQNVDDLHERAGSSRVIHLHGELMKACSSAAPDDVRFIRRLTPDAPDVVPGTCAADGSLLRPWIVWFGEAVPKLDEAAREVASADAFAIIGTSLNVYPAAGLVRHVPDGVPVFLIDPEEVRVPSNHAVTVIRDVASNGVARLESLLRGAGKYSGNRNDYIENPNSH